MTSTLFMVSFLLHIISLFAIYILFKEIQKLKKPTYIEDIDELLTVYLEELREENARLEKRLSDETAKQPTSASGYEEEPTAEPAGSSTVRNLEEEERAASLFADLLTKEERRHEAPAEKVMADLPVDEAGDHFTASLQSRILQLSEQGMSPSEIAKQLDCGETEAALVIKMHKRNTKG